MKQKFLSYGLLLSLGLVTCSVNAQTLTGADVGTPSMPGSVTKTTEAGATVYTVVGGGSDIWGAADNFYYAYFKVTGDFDYVVKVASLVGNANDGGWSKAELMARVDDGSGAPSTGDPFLANMCNRPSSDTANSAPAGVNNRGPQFRCLRDDQCSWTSPSPAYPPNANGNNWLRMERVGSVLYMYTSDDGKAWNMYNPWNPQGWDTKGSWPAGTDNPTVASFTNAWPNTILLGLAVTAHSDGDTTTAKFSNFGPYTPTPVAISTQPAATVTVAQNNAFELSVTASGDPVHYEWRKNGTPIAQAVSSTYKVDLAQTSDSGTYTVRVFGGGKEIVSSSSVVTVTTDTTPPTIAKVTPLVSFKAVKVEFSEPVTDSALTVGNYALDNGVAVSSVTRTATNAVELTTGTMTSGTQYTLTVNNVKDTASPANTIAANTKYTFSSVTFATGFATYQRWQYTADPGSIDDLITALTDGTLASPTVESTVSQFGAPWGVADYYWARVFGWFVPPTTGNYVFFTSSDDGSNIYLSTDETPANKKLIAQEGGWSNQYQWTTPGSGDATTKRSDQFAGEWPSGNTITLTAGKKYYMEALLKEGSGGDGVDVTYIMAGDADPSQDSAGMKMRGSVIGTYIDPNGAKVNITTQPASVQGVDGKSVTFKVVADTYSPLTTSVSYQWFKNGTAISGATLPSYTTAVALADNNAKYKVSVTVPGLTATSSEATLTVVADTFPPVPSASAIKNQTGTYDVGIGFDEDVDQVELAKQANYTLSGGTVTGFKAYKTGVTLTASGLTAGTTYTVTVKNVADLKGNKITTANADFKVGKMAWGEVGADELGLGGNGVIAISDSSFDVYSDGAAEWGTYDESTLVYEEITGDFDKKVRVEFQESSSQWARAGLIARDVTNFGVNRETQTGTATAFPYDGKAGRYQKVHVNPVTTVMGTAGNNSWEGNRRTITGAATTSAGGGGTPLYPNAWCRLQRVGQTFTIYRSDDGVNWTQLGATTWPDSADTDNTLMPSKVYVGIDYSPELGNISDTTLQRAFYAKFRDYGDTFSAKPTLSATHSGSNLVITYTGTLLSAPSIAGPWTAVSGATSPYTAATTATQTFYRSSR